MLEKVNRRRTYSKICIVCSRSFISQRINALYCSKKCNNNARSIPDDLKMTLIKRNEVYTMSADVITAHLAGGTTETYVKTHIPPQLDRSMGIKNASKANPAGDDLGLLIEYAKQEARARGINPPDVKKEDFINKDYMNVDGNITFKPNIDDSLPDPDDDGLSGPSNNHPTEQAKPTFVEDQQDNKEEQPVVRKGIRKLGGK